MKLLLVLAVFCIPLYAMNPIYKPADEKPRPKPHPVETKIDQNKEPKGHIPCWPCKRSVYRRK